jgi:hypothetical protein
VLVVENEQEVFTAVIALKDGQGSFADAVIAATGARMGCSCTLTFDRNALRLPGFELPQRTPNPVQLNTPINHFAASGKYNSRATFATKNDWIHKRLSHKLAVLLLQQPLIRRLTR